MLLLEYAIIAFIIGSFLGFLMKYKLSTTASSAMAVIGSGLILAQVFDAYISGPITGTVFNVPINIDGLSTIFLFIVGIVSLGSSVYSLGYMRLHRKRGEGWVYAIAYNVFIASMAFVVSVNNLEYFVIFWELMTLSSFILIFWKEERKDIDASLKYYITMHFADTIPLFLLLGFSSTLTGSIHDLSYPTIQNALMSAPASTKTVFYVLSLSVFISKAGIVPLHFWLPDAHPAAPSNVSALLSGVMIKTAVFGLLKFDWQLSGQNTNIGYLVAILGTITLIVGTLYALRETNSKRLLAYHSIGQMGYIWLGLGIGMVLLSRGGALAAIGALGMFAGLFHAVNHAIFKGSLFLEAGSVEYATGTMDLDKLGGLGSKMRVTALATLFSSLAIAGIPPFNGFISKWLIYVAGFQSQDFILAIGAVMAVFISAVTLASFIKFYNAQFGGEMKIYKKVKEVPISMQTGEWILAGLTLFIGIFPWFFVKFLNKGVASVNNGITAPITSNIYNIGFGSVMFSPLIFGGIFVILAIVLYLSLKPKYSKTAVPWDCGATKINEDEYKMNAEGYYRWYEQTISSFYKFTDWCYIVGKGIVHYTVRAYIWIASYFVRIPSAPNVKVESVSDLRDGEILYIDEETFKPLVRVLRISRDLVPGIKLRNLVALAVIVLGVIIGILIALGGV